MIEHLEGVESRRFFFGSVRKCLKMMTNSQVQAAVIEALQSKNSGISVSADDGRVTLTGTVRSWNDRAVAGASTWATPGVNHVNNDIAVSY